MSKFQSCAKECSETLPKRISIRTNLSKQGWIEIRIENTIPGRVFSMYIVSSIRTNSTRFRLPKHTGTLQPNVNISIRTNLPKHGLCRTNDTNRKYHTWSCIYHVHTVLSIRTDSTRFRLPKHTWTLRPNVNISIRTNLPKKGLCRTHDTNRKYHAW